MGVFDVVVSVFVITTAFVRLFSLPEKKSGGLNVLFVVVPPFRACARGGVIMIYL